MTSKPTKAEYRKTQGRFEPVEPTVAGPEGGGVGGGPRPKRRGPRFVLPLIVALVVGVYLDKTGSLSFWPAGVVASRLMPMLPAPLQATARWIDTAISPAPTTDTPQGGGRSRPGGTQAVPVLAEPVRLEDVPVLVSAVGTVQALATVTVKPQVDGLLLDLGFVDGQMVKKGDVIARIDGRTYQAQYDQAVAKKAQDEAQLANAEADLIRYQKLATTDYGSKQQADTQKALVAQLQSLVRADQGAIDNVRAILDYTTVRAPLDGRTGIRAVDSGNIIHASDPNGIVVITQIQPISVVFNLPQQNLKAVFAAADKGSVAVQALEADDKSVIDRGVIAVIDNQVDQTTGTIKLKATFPNQQNQLWPGQFVNIRVLVDTLKGATVVPTGSVQRGPAGAYVYVLNDDLTVKQTPVTIGRQDETKAVVTSGVQPGARVVVTGFTRLVDGSKVSIGDTTPAQPAAATPVPAGQKPNWRDRKPDGQAPAVQGERRRRSDPNAPEAQPADLAAPGGSRPVPPAATGAPP